MVNNLHIPSSIASTPSSASSLASAAALNKSMQVFSAFFYGTSSLLIMFVNKYVLTSEKFPSFMALALAQYVATIIILQFLKLTRKTQFPDFSWAVVLKVFPLPILFLLNSTTGLGGTKFVSLPMLTVLRRFNIFLTMVLEYFVLGVTSSPQIKLSVMMLIGGAIIASIGDLSFDLLGYIYIFVNNLCSAFSGVLLKKKLDAKDLGTIGILYYNSLLSIPFILLYFILITPDEWTACRLYPGWSSSWFVFMFVLNAIMGLILNYSLFLCTHYNSALSTTIVGCIKNIFSTYAGMVFGGDYIFSWANFVGLNVSVFGSLYYSYVKHIEQSKPSLLPTALQRGS